jgi:preprotein translocase subunit SecG
MFSTLQFIFLIITVLLTAGLFTVTVWLNTKSDGLGAAITGASDSYRGAVGVEEQKRNLLRTLCYLFMGAAFIYGWLAQY